MLAPTMVATVIGSPTTVGFTPASHGEPGTQVVSSHNATNGIDGSACRTIGSVRQSKLWISTRSILPADRITGRIVSTNSAGPAEFSGFSASTLVSML